MAQFAREGVTKIFPGGTVAVDHVDLEIADGELLVLVGPSGSGKTTGLRLAAGLGELNEGGVPGSTGSIPSASRFSAGRATGCATTSRSTGSSASGAEATAARSRSGICCAS